MSKLNDLISNEISALAKKKLDLINYHIENDKIDRMLESDLHKVAKSLMGSNLHELKPLLEKWRNKEIELLKRFLHVQASGKNMTDTERHEQIHFELVIKSIELAIQMKREYRKQYNSHILEKNLIQGGVFLTGTPHPGTMNKLSGGDILELERRGFRPMVYKNDNGAILNSYDTKVLIGLFKLWLTRGKNKLIQFEFKELAEAMITRPSGGEYRLIYESLKNIAATWLEYKEYFDPETSKFYSATIKHRPIKSLAWIARTKDEEGGKERAAVISFHDVLHDSLLAGNYVFINMVIYNELPTTYSRIIYLNILDAIESNASYFELDTLIDHLILKEDEAFNRARTIRTIETSFRHLADADIITGFSLHKTGRKFTHVSFQPSEWLTNGRKNLTTTIESSASLEKPIQMTLLDA